MSHPFTPSSDDTAIQMMIGIFGPAFARAAGVEAPPGTATASMLSEAFRYFNSGVLLFGAIIVLYVTVMGVVNTANDGEALGRKWSTFFTPLRTFSAAALLIPTSSGYAAIQLLMFYIVAASIGFASNLWKSTANFILADEVDRQIITSVVDDRTFETVANNIIRMRVCAYAAERALNATNVSGSQIQMRLNDPINTVNNNSDGREYISTFFYSDPNWATSKTLCGTMHFTSVFKNPESNSNITNSSINEIQQGLDKVRFTAFQSLFTEAGVLPISRAIIAAAEGGDVVKAQDIKNRIVALRTNLTEKLKADVRARVQSSRTDNIDKLTGKGWMWAGSLHMEVARIKDAITSASKTRNEFVQGANKLDHISSGDVLLAQKPIFNQYMHVLELALGKASSAAEVATTNGTAMPAFDSNFSEADFEGQDGIAMGNIKRLFSGVGSKLIVGVTSHLTQQEKDALWQVKDMGDYISSYVEAFMAVKASAVIAMDGLMKTQEGLANQPGLGIPAAVTGGAMAAAKAAITEGWNVIAPSTYTLLYLGYFMGIWLPAVPFIISALAAVGWVIACLESFIAGTLWMAAHTTPAREDSFIGSQTQGYLLLLSLFFRPALIVFGLIASLAILNPLVGFINQAFILFFRSAQADSVTGLLSVAGFILVYCILIFSVFMMIFTLPQQFPDRILKWIGAGTGDVGEIGAQQRIEHGASSQARGALMAVIASGKARKNKDNLKKAAASNASKNHPEGFA